MRLKGWVGEDQQIKEVGKYERVTEGREGLDDSAVGSGGTRYFEVGQQNTARISLQVGICRSFSSLTSLRHLRKWFDSLVLFEREIKEYWSHDSIANGAGGSVTEIACRGEQRNVGVGPLC